MNGQEFRAALCNFGACESARDWVASRRDLTPEELWNTCERGDWLLWLAQKAGVAIPDAAIRPAVLRALQEYAPAALERAGMGEHAASLRALPDDVEWHQARGLARSAAYAAADAAYAAADAADAAAYAAYAAADAADAAAYADAYAAAYAAADAAYDAAYAAAYAAADAERSRQAPEVRAAIPWALVEEGLVKL